MEDFYFYSCVVALIILLLLLTLVGITVSYSKGKQVFPPTLSTCPDYWQPVAGTFQGNDASGGAFNISPDYCVYTGSSTDNTNSGDANFIESPDNNKIMPGRDALTEISRAGVSSYLVKGGLGSSYTNTGISPNPSIIPKPKHTQETAVGDQYIIQMNNNDSQWTNYPNYSTMGLTPRCVKRRWANERGIVWDGVSNYNGCQ
jgi:hypothetical protein